MFWNKIKINTFQAFVMIFAVFSFYLWSASASSQFLGGNREFTVNRGDNFLEIAQNLKSAGIIKSRISFIFSSIYRGSFLSMKAGEYIFEPGLNLVQVMEKIEKGEAIHGSNEAVVVFPEGLTLNGIAQKLENAGFSDAEDIVRIKASSFSSEFSWLNFVDSKYNSLEGFLFPDTYRFPKDASLQEILRRMLKRFEEKTLALRQSVSVSGENFYDILILGSILEKEIPIADMPLASGVLWNRLNLGMPLQADATLVYSLGRPIKRSDTSSLDSPYNTYKHNNLPPTPISNPGLKALNAALNPQKTDYLFYLSRPHDGATVFSKTLEQHNLAKAKYLNN